LALEADDKRFELFGGNGTEFAAEEFLAEGAEEGGEPNRFLVAGTLEFFIEAGAFGVFERLDFGFAAAAPIDQSRFGDSDLGRDAGETPALKA
jgi:hypothetical protein